ncbi:helix-turn-helix transcriptional regulator [Kitasatospora purpeofusca]|uniref:helix-turn-helix transcriptional regulator n=1 Tax=Kitasatospora purpeofusca TaxID=67352 RepID=UPI002257D165|nr:LuxR family transcriptional regulator [Kitasatospora purpeofusca]MCX4758901.1 AAA family ATPase [Kitasatospora purpeofusca]WSR30676.1 AAA family ATPase [Kitasatospora purpeofusca]
MSPLPVSPPHDPYDPSRSAPAGRESEYRRLHHALDRCAAGAGSVIVLHGSVGSGRSDLLYAFTDTAAERGVQVLVGTGSPLEREFPLGLARQLLQGADLAPEEAATAEALLAEGAASGTVPAPSDRPAGQLTQRVLEGLFRLVRGLAERAPVLIAVDDRQDADPQSLEFLLYLVRRTRGTGVLTVLSSRETMTPAHPLFEVELARQPHHQHIRLDLLGTELVAEVLRTRLGAAAAERHAAEAHALTGGNPLLVHSLVGDQERAGSPGTLVVGEGYRRGLMHCLHRIDPLALHYARGVAVLGTAATPELLAELLLLAPDALPRALYLLHAAGLFRDGGFRHPTAAGDLLAAMRPLELAALHQRAGRLLRAAGATAATVDGHARVAEGHLRSSLGPAPAAGAGDPGAVLPEFERGGGAWEVPAPGVAEDVVEDEAAEETADEESGATGGFGPVPAHALQLWSGRAPAGPAVECVPTLPGTVTDADTALRHELKRLRHHFWHGRIDEGTAALARFEAVPGQAVHTEPLRHWLAYWYPALLPNPARRTGPQDGAPADRGDGMRLLAALLAGTVSPEDAVVHAELVLRAGRLGGVRTESLTAALTVLLYADRADRATHWCAPLAERAGARCGAHWNALLAALRAEAALRQGDLRSADEAGRAAFAHVRPEAWGVAVGLPLATMAAARTALGLHQDAAHFLELATPAGLEHTPAGLHHRYALAGHRLALGRAEQALADYRACGDTMARWGVDHLPAIAPWRLGAARAQLALGRPGSAAALADQQLARLGPAGHPRIRGLALRIRAAAGGPAERTELLERAVGLLEEAGAESELSAALGELSEAHQHDGDPGRARRADRRVRRSPALAVVPVRPQAQAPAPVSLLPVSPLPASPLQVSPPPVAGRPLPVAAAPVPEGSAGGLSEAEGRVAELAARGLSNRDIARKLYITVSTVEQHLTRVYRKLGVRRRVDLARLLGPVPPGTADGAPPRPAFPRRADLVAG